MLSPPTTYFFFFKGDITTYVIIPIMGASLKGVTAHQADLLMTFLGTASVAGRLLVGATEGRTKPLVVWSISCLGAGVCCVVYPFLLSYGALAFFAAAHGLFIAGYISTLALAALDLFGLEKVNIACGILHFSCGLGMFCIFVWFWPRLTEFGPPMWQAEDDTAAGQSLLENSNYTLVFWTQVHSRSRH